MSRRIYLHIKNTRPSQGSRYRVKPLLRILFVIRMLNQITRGYCPITNRTEGSRGSFSRAGRITRSQCTQIDLFLNDIYYFYVHFLVLLRWPNWRNFTILTTTTIMKSSPVGSNWLSKLSGKISSQRPLRWSQSKAE